MRIIAEALQDGRTKRYSAKRLAMLMACLSMSVSLIILALAAYHGRVVDVALSGLAASLAGLGGWTYVGGKSAEAKRNNETEAE